MGHRSDARCERIRGLSHNCKTKVDCYKPPFKKPLGCRFNLIGKARVEIGYVRRLTGPFSRHPVVKPKKETSTIELLLTQPVEILLHLISS
jgi:hypothetical protein